MGAGASHQDSYLNSSKLRPTGEEGLDGALPYVGPSLAYHWPHKGRFGWKSGVSLPLSLLIVMKRESSGSAAG